MNGGRSRRSNKKPWKTTNVLAGQHLAVDWSIGRQSATRRERQKVLDDTDSSTQRNDMT